MESIGLRAVIDMSNFNKGLGQYTSGISQMTNVTKGFASSVGRDFVGLGQGVLKFGAIAGGAALVGVTALGAAITKMTVSGIKGAINLDAQMSAIAATMNLTKDAVAPLKDLIIDLGLDPNLTVNTQQAADAIQLLAQNGATADEIMGGLAKSTVALANATGANFGTAANIASGVLRVFNMDAKDMGAAIDGITGVTNKSKFTIEDYGLAFAAAGGIAAGMGVSLKDLNTVITGTANSFSSGSDAGTSFKTFLQRLANPTGEIADLMQKYNISLFDATGKMRPMREVVGQLNRAFSGLTEAQKAQVASQLGGADAARTVLALAGMTVDEYDKLSGSVNESGQAFKNAATRMNSTQGALDILGGIIEGIQLQIGDKFLPIVRSMTVSFSDIATKYGPLVVDIFGSIADKMSYAIQWLSVFGNLLGTAFQTGGIGGILDLLGITPDALVLFDLIKTSIFDLANTVMSNLTPAFNNFAGIIPTINTIISFMVEHFDEIKGAMIGIGAVLAGGVIAALIAGLLSLLTPINLIIAGAALLGAAWAGNWGGIQDKVSVAWAFIQPILMNIWNWLKTNIPIAVQYLADVWTNNLLPAFTQVWGAIQTNIIPLFTRLFTYLSSNGPGIIQQLSDVWTGVLLPALQWVADFVLNTLLPIWTDILVKALEYVPVVVNNVISVWNFLVDAFNTALPIINGITDVIMSLGNFFNSVLNLALKASAGLWQNVLLPAITTVYDYLNATFQPALTFLSDFIKNNFGSSITNAQGLLGGLKTVLSDIGGILQNVAGFFNNLTGSINNFQLPPALTPGSPTPFELGLSGIASVASGVLPNALQTLLTAFKMFGTLTISYLSNIDSLFASITSYISISMPVALKKLLVVMNDVFLAIIATLDDVNAALNFEGKINGIVTAARNAKSVLKDISNAGDNYGDLISKINSVTSALKRMENAAKDAAAATRSAGSSATAATGMGFSRGIGFVAGTAANTNNALGLGYQIPAGYPNDSFGPMYAQSGEQMLITPRGKSIEELVSQRLGSFLGSFGARQAPSITINTGDINNGMDLEMLGNFIETRVAQAFG